MELVPIPNDFGAPAHLQVSNSCVSPTTPRKIRPLYALIGCCRLMSPSILIVGVSSEQVLISISQFLNSIKWLYWIICLTNTYMIRTITYRFQRKSNRLYGSFAMEWVLVDTCSSSRNDTIQWWLWLAFIDEIIVEYIIEIPGNTYIYVIVILKKRKF